MFLAVVLSLLAGGVATSLAEFKIGYNFIDKVLDLFRSVEVKAENSLTKAKKFEAEAISHVKRIASAARGK